MKFFFKQLYYKIDGFCTRMYDLIRSYPLRLKRLILHFFIKKPPCLDRKYITGRSGTLIRAMDWLYELGLLGLDCLGIPEWYETFIDVFKFRTRPLRPDEIELARSVFGSSLNYRRIRIDDRAWLVSRPRKVAYVSFHTINSWGPLPEHILIHEMVHIWQYRQFGSVYILKALMAQYSPKGYNYGGVDGLIQRTDFREFNLEQQGDVVADYFRILNGLEPEWGSGSWEDLEHYRKFIKQLI